MCRTLLVSDKARVTVMPSMEIIANDVKCTHGATVCDLEDEELFYLMSRGISKIQVRVFCNSRAQEAAREVNARYFFGSSVSNSAAGGIPSVCTL